MRALGCATVAVLGLALARPAGAREGEVELTLGPAVGVTHRHGQWRHGPAMSVGVRYGVEPFDWLAVEGTLHGDQVGALEQPIGPRGSRFYDARRMGTTASVLARAGNRIVGWVSVGLGYRYESRRNAIELAAPAGVEAGGASRHHAVAAFGAAVQWRIVDRFSAALWARADIASLRRNMDGATGLSLGVHLWP